MTVQMTKGLGGSRGTGVDLLSLLGTDMVQPTSLSRKITYAGKTNAYPVYKVRLDALYYNDQNDRIATWITRYRGEHGAEALEALEGEAYNEVIENFIYESNPESIQKTQKNIALIGQREPGVALADGRIVDGNRRYTCLRRIQRDSKEPVYFETVIMDVDIRKDKKQIKLLELAIQHGEEKKVDYDLIDYAIGTYMDVVKTGLLTIEEYAGSTNEPVSEVKKRIECAELICQLLEHLRLPGQYHVARELQVYSLCSELMAPLHQLKGIEKQQLKTIVFNNVLLHAILDQRKFIRDLKGLIKNDTYEQYFEDQQRLGAEIRRRFEAQPVSSKADLDRFAQENEDLAEELQMLMQRALLRSRKQQLKEKPSENVSKCISLMTDVDSRLFDKMDEPEKASLRRELVELGGIIEMFGDRLGGRAVRTVQPQAPAQSSGRYLLAQADPAKPYVVCTTAGRPITRFFVSMGFTAVALGEGVTDAVTAKVFFVDDGGNTISDVRELTLSVGGETTVNISMRPDSLNLRACRLVIQTAECAADEALQVIPFALNISSGFRR